MFVLWLSLWGCVAPTPSAHDVDARTTGSGRALATPAAAPASWTDATAEWIGPRAPLFDHARGLVDAPFVLTLSAPRGVQIRYTTDGHDPAGPYGVDYTAPLTISTTTVLRVAQLVGDAPFQPEETRTFLFPADIPGQRAPTAWPTQWWTDASGGPYTADYAMDRDVTGSGAWADATDLFRDIPIVSLAVAPDDLFGPTGIHEHPLEVGIDWERVASVEIFQADGSLDVGAPCGLRIHGGASRRAERSPKKSFRLLFRDEYGDGRLDAPLFPDSDVQSFDTLVLRAGYNRSWIHTDALQRDRAQYLHERFANDIERAMGHPAARVRFVHLFLDGLYWGVYQLEERNDGAFMASLFGGTEDDYDTLDSGEVMNGDRVAWDAMMTAARAGLDSDARYDALLEWLDVDAFADYMLLNLTLGNEDWPDHNWWAARMRTDGARWVFIPTDAELTMPFTTKAYTDVTWPDSPGELFQLLRVNEEFRVRFGDRAQRQLFHAGPLSTDGLIARWEALAPTAWPALVGESARWGDHMRDVRGATDAILYTYQDSWTVENARIHDEFLPQRLAYVLADFQAKGLYPTVPAPDLSPLGGPVAAGAEIEVDAAQGEVWVTLDGSDPRLRGGGVNPSAVLVDEDLRVDVTSTVRARARLNGQWSALVQADYTVP